MKDLARLRTLFDLFAEVLQELCHEGEAYEDDVEIHIRRLSAPGGEIKDKYLLWEGDGPRRDAAAALGRLGNPAAVPALSSVLRDEDALLRARAIEALAAIGHTDAVGPLIPLLGDTRDADGEPVQERVAAALRQLGAGDRVDVALAALRGDLGPLKADDGAYRAQMVAALEGALEGPLGTHAANALAGIHAVEALPRLREVLRRTGSQEAAGPAVATAVRRLEARAALPRAASAARVGLDTLPRSARAPGPDSRTLPRGSDAPPEEDRGNRIDRTPRED
ncbi:MAG: HEAT repeat domain-containing protein [Gammaproteobacteria bacterium]|nr:HEAT repeat domain-containing protein [Gammaproteobacteria bacterium]MYF60244.1 HEAT repeat domain-containing protein [Gammaproteobacteria bacterium]MYI21876.1 HEAT repeat domain-containing protein [Gammaproteobacteria bacterium]